MFSIPNDEAARLCRPKMQLLAEWTDDRVAMGRTASMKSRPDILCAVIGMRVSMRVSIQRTDSVCSSVERTWQK